MISLFPRTAAILEASLPVSGGWWRGEVTLQDKPQNKIPKYPTPSPDTLTNPSHYTLSPSSREIPLQMKKIPVPMGLGPLLVCKNPTLIPLEENKYVCPKNFLELGRLGPEELRHSLTWENRPAGAFLLNLVCLDHLQHHRKGHLCASLQA